MNRRKVFQTVGRMLKLLAALLILPAVVCIIYGERTPLISFAVTAAAVFIIGFVIARISHPKSDLIFAKEGFTITALSWLSFSFFGAIPFFISGEIPSFIDALFETVSGFTTTGASILTDVESLSHGMLFWRSFTHWIGGMGILVFMMAITSSLSERSIHLMRAEMPGPIIGKQRPRASDTAKALYYIYLGLSGLELILLLCGGMPIFDSFIYTFGTAGTGGFAIKNTGLAGLSPYVKWVITAFMFAFGINFNVYFLVIMGKAKQGIKSGELFTYIGIVAVSIAVITANIYPIYGSFGESVRESAFQTASIISTTGFSTADFNLWPNLSKAILFCLMFIGGCAGSTAGGLKVGRCLILFKMVRRQIKSLLHPRSVTKVRFEGKTVSEDTLSATAVYFAFYCLLIILAFLVLSAEPFGMETNLSAAVSCFNNIGPAFGLCGPASNYSIYSGISKLVLSTAMMLGRLEIFPLILLFSPSTWSKK